MATVTMECLILHLQHMTSSARMKWEWETEWKGMKKNEKSHLHIIRHKLVLVKQIEKIETRGGKLCASSTQIMCRQVIETVNQ